jgi:AraC-like DNA-binding protein
VLKVRLSDHDATRDATPLEIHFSITPYFYETAWFVMFVWLAVIGLLLFFTRSYIQRFRIRMITQLGELKSRSVHASTLSKISEEKFDEIKADLLKLMNEEKPWMNSSLRQAEVAAASGRSVHEISQLLNVQMKQNFQDFVNSYRVEEVKARIQRGETHKYTLTAIALQSGFSAKSSFQRAFKKATGLTPSDYLKNQGLKTMPDTNKPS